MAHISGAILLAAGVVIGFRLINLIARHPDQFRVHKKTAIHRSVVPHERQSFFSVCGENAG
jgi:hypothetical protein